MSQLFAVIQWMSQADSADLLGKKMVCGIYTKFVKFALTRKSRFSCKSLQPVFAHARADAARPHNSHVRTALISHCCTHDIST